VSSDGTVGFGTQEYSQFVTTAPDGQILVWDTEDIFGTQKLAAELDLTWVPRYSLTLTNSPSALAFTSCQMIIANDNQQLRLFCTTLVRG
jgi:hypothetical protein